MMLFSRNMGLLILCCIAEGAAINSQAAENPLSYYVDSANGNDANNGISPETAWQSLNNANHRIFQPGDRLLFKAGGRWDGQLRLKGSGLANRPIKIGSYGEGSLPVIDQGKLAGVAVQFEDQDFWEMTGIEVDGGSPKPDQKVGGIHFLTTSAGRIEVTSLFQAR